MDGDAVLLQRPQASEMQGQAGGLGFIAAVDWTWRGACTSALATAGGISAAAPASSGTNAVSSSAITLTVALDARRGQDQHVMRSLPQGADDLSGRGTGPRLSLAHDADCNLYSGD